MKLRHLNYFAVSAALAFATAVTGCGSKQADSNPTPASTETAASPQSQSPAAAAPVVPSPAPAPISDARLAESQAAINARDYEKAAATLVAIRQSQLNEQQAIALAKQMQQLQGNLAGAIANGDPRAKAAADRLRQSATVR